MKIVFMEADSLGTDLDLGYFQTLGDVTYYGTEDGKVNAERIKEADVIVANKVPMNEELLKDCKNLKLICISATGTNVVDFDYVNRRNITVTNVAGYSTESVAQHTFAMLFYLYEKLSYYDEYVKGGKYSESGMFAHFDNRFYELQDKTMGIIGLGQIGRRVASLARGFGMHVIYFSTTGNHEDPNFERVPFEELLQRSDVISVHAPLNEKTYHLLDEKAFHQMKSSAIVLNLGRGPILCQNDLAKALKKGEIQAAGIDVMEKEPIPAEDELMDIQDSTRLLITPHMAWGTVEARNRLARAVYQNIESFMNGTPIHVVKE